jgi:hypothetical protein
VLSLHQIDKVDTEKHLHLCEPVFEKLFFSDQRLVVQQVDHHSLAFFEKLDVREVLSIGVQTLVVKPLGDEVRSAEHRAVKDFQEFLWVPEFGPRFKFKVAEVPTTLRCTSAGTGSSTSQISFCHLIY